MSAGNLEKTDELLKKVKSEPLFERSPAVLRRTPHVMNPKSWKYYRKCQKRAEKWLGRFFANKLSAERFAQMVDLGFTIASDPEMVNHPHHHKYWSWFMNMATPNRILDKKKPENNITLVLESQQREIDYARVRLGIKPIQINVIKEKELGDVEPPKQEDKGDRRSLPEPVRELPSPVSSEADTGPEQA